MKTLVIKDVHELGVMRDILPSFEIHSTMEDEPLKTLRKEVEAAYNKALCAVVFTANHYTRERLVELVDKIAALSRLGERLDNLIDGIIVQSS